MRRHNYKNRRIVVTGLGVVSSLGIGWEEFWQNILAGKSGINPITAFDTSPYNRHLGGEINNFRPEMFIPKKSLPLLGRASQMAVAASKLAFEDANISLQGLSKNRIGVCIGTTMGEPQIMERIDEDLTRKGRYSVNGRSICSYPSENISVNISLQFKLEGKVVMFSSACAAGNYSIGYACDLIRNGRADYMLAGGSDALSRIAFAGFSRMYAMAPEKCQPFDKNRKGMILGEGAGVVFLETLENAQQRGAEIYGEIIGYGVSCDARNMTNPSPHGIQKAISAALNQSGIFAKDVGYINAHGTGTKENDKAECSAFREIFGSALENIPISSSKSMLGHTMGAASAIESIICLLAIKYQQVPPTINYKEKDPECDIDCVPNFSRKALIRIALNNSLAFGGNNCSLVVMDFRK